MNDFPLLDTSKPIVWTKYGNLNTDLLRTSFEVSFAENGSVACTVLKHLKSTGELVHESKYVRVVGVEALADGGSFGS